jgi:uncharacterized membrane protein YbhN (UPF0104 family)
MYKNPITRYVVSIIGVLLFVGVIYFTSWRNFSEILVGMDYLYLSIAIFFGIIATFIRSLRFRFFFLTNLSHFHTYAAFAWIRVVNYVMPFRSGEIVALMILKRGGFSSTITEISPVWLLMRIADFTGLFIIMTLATLASSVGSSLFAVGTSAAMAAVLVLVSLLFNVASRRMLDWAETRWGRRSWAQNRIGLLRQGLARLTQPNAHPVLQLGAIAIWAANAGVTACTLLALGVELSVLSCLLISTLAFAVGLLPIRAPLGIGTVDLTWAGLLMAFGVDQQTAISLALGVRLVQTLLVIIDAILAWVFAAPARPRPAV